jgi:deoxyhypusine synthase
MRDGSVSAFLEHNFRHFNAAALIAAANGYKEHLEKGGRMFLALAGAMSTAELGVSLAEMIRQEKVHAVCCTGANLEEDVFNLIAHNSYERIPNYRDLTSADELALFDRDLSRVTDTCIPYIEAMRGSVRLFWMNGSPPRAPASACFRTNSFLEYCEVGGSGSFMK